jgi:EmrB/QacA subfamily drug resistance transporter
VASVTGEPAASETTEVSTRRRYAILAVCCLSLFVLSLDNTIVNVALPSIRSSLGASTSGLQWTVDAYVLVLAGLVTAGGSMGDRFGHLRVFNIGLVIFTAGSLACSLAPSLGVLIAFRVLQGVGGSMLNANSLALITSVFTDAKERAFAYGFWGSTFGVSAAAGPVLGGALTDSIGWRSIFWVNVPIGIAALVLSRWLVPESKAEEPRPLDVPGQALLIAMLGTATFAIIGGPGRGGLSATTLGVAAAAVVLVGCFVAVERRSRAPVIDLRFFRSRPFSGAIAIAVLAFAVLGAFLFLNTLYLQEARGYSPLKAGLATLPMTAIVALGAPFSGRLVGRSGARAPLVGAGVLMTAGAAVLVGTSVGSSYGVLVIAYALLGGGFGLVNPPITNTAIMGMPRSQSGTAAAVASTGRQVGSVLGVAIVGSIAGPFAPRAGWILLAACAAAVVLTAAWATRVPASASPRSADGYAE